MFRSPDLAAVSLVSTCFLVGAVASPRLQEQPPRFQAEVAAVLVDVLVLDEKGQPVSDLTQEDFQILEDEVIQQIASFDVIDWTSYVARQAPLEGRPLEPAPKAAVNTVPRRFLFVVNRQGAEFGYLVRARRALESFVVESMAEGDEAMIVDIGASTRILQQFTDSKEETLRVVRKLQPMPIDIFIDSEIATRNVYDALESLGEGLARFPGRKIVLFLSTELNRNQHLLTYLRDTVNALNQSNTTVYSIDIQGTSSGATADQAGLESAVADEAAATSGSLDSFDIGGLFPLANETGGRYYYNLNTFEPAVRRIGEENRRYYLLTYTPTNTDLDGKYRHIEVRVNRPNVTVKARRGYFARKEGRLVAQQARPQPPEAQPQKPGSTPQPTPKAGSSSPPSTNAAPLRPPKQVEITSYLFPAANGKVDVPVIVALPLNLLTSDTGDPVSRDLKVTIRDSSGGEAEILRQKVDANDFYVIRSAALAPGSYLIQIHLEDSGKSIYQASTPIDVPKGFGERFGVSSIVPVLPPASQPSGRNEARLRPTPTIPQGEDVFIHFRIFPGREDPSNTANVVYSIYRDEEELEALQNPEPLPLSKSKEDSFPVVAKLPTGKLAPGTYRIVVGVSDAGRGRRATGELLLTVQ